MEYFVNTTFNGRLYKMSNVFENVIKHRHFLGGSHYILVLEFASTLHAATKKDLR